LYEQSSFLTLAFGHHSVCRKAPQDGALASERKCVNSRTFMHTQCKTLADSTVQTRNLTFFILLSPYHAGLKVSYGR